MLFFSPSQKIALISLCHLLSRHLFRKWQGIYFFLLSLGEVHNSKLSVGKLSYLGKITFFYLEGFQRCFEDQIILGNNFKFIEINPSGVLIFTCHSFLAEHCIHESTLAMYYVFFSMILCGAVTVND